MRSDFSTLLPRDKLETEKAEAIVAQGFPTVEPILPALLEWMQDLNWPVAQVLQPFLANIGAPLAPHIRRVLESDDDVWKGWVLHFIVAKSAELQIMLRPDLERLAAYPTPGEKAEALDILAKETL